MTVRVDVVAMSHVGRVRECNEDFALMGSYCPDLVDELGHPVTHSFDVDVPAIVAVIDGLGGHAGGDLAAQYVAGFLYSHQAAASDRDSVVELLTRVNEAMFELTQNPDYAWMRGAGATIAGLAFGPDGLVWFNVGDSRLYAWEGGYLTQLSVDDSPGGPEGGTRTSMVLQTIGGTTSLVSIEPHVGGRPLRPGDRYLLCSDGLTDLVSVQAMEAAIEDDAAGSVERLVDLALDAGGRDNVTVALVEVAGAGGW